MGRESRAETALASGLLQCMGPKGPGRKDTAPSGEPEGFKPVVKKLLVVGVLALSAFAVWRKVQADRAELNLWTAATTDDD